jgi:hypothetical protein
MRNLSMFRELCGENALHNVILTTTMWDELGEDSIVGATREYELRTKIWKPMMDRGCKIARFAGTRESAWQLISTFNHSHYPVKLQEELVDQGKKLNETSAYAVLNNWWNTVISYFRPVLRVAKEHRTPPHQETEPGLGSRLTHHLDDRNESQSSLLSASGFRGLSRVGLLRHHVSKYWLKRPQTPPISGMPALPQAHPQLSPSRLPEKSHSVRYLFLDLQL